MSVSLLLLSHHPSTLTTTTSLSQVSFVIQYIQSLLASTHSRRGVIPLQALGIAEEFMGAGGPLHGVSLTFMGTWLSFL
jgi:hypothetical protein